MHLNHLKIKVCFNMQKNIKVYMRVYFPHLSELKVDGISKDMLQFPSDFTCLPFSIQSMPRLDSKQIIYNYSPSIDQATKFDDKEGKA
jgi:hypothetical protein